MKSHVLAGLSFATAFAGAMLFTATAPGVFADDHDKKTDVTISDPVEVPGGVVLQPGTYMFKLMEVTGNRHVVQISSEDGKKTYAIVMTAAARRTEPTDKTVLTFYEMPAGQPQAVRRWFWPSDLDGQEFLYPHKRALEISKASKETVKEAPEETVATNIPQENVSAADNKPENKAFDKDDKVDKGDKADKDEKRESAANIPAAVTPAPEPEHTETVTQTTTVVAPEPAPTQSDRSELLAQANPPATSYKSASSADRNASQSSDNSRLPQTASDLPLMALVGGLSLAGAITVRCLRRA